MTDQQAIDEILGALDVPTLADAAVKTRELAAATPLVSVDGKGQLVIARLTFRQLAQVIAALENAPMAG